MKRKRGRRSCTEKKAYRLRRRARELGVFSSLTRADIITLYATTKSCYYCHKTRKLTVDHVVPLCRGGTNSVDNVVLACDECNNWKADKEPHVFLFELAAQKVLSKKSNVAATSPANHRNSRVA